MTPPRRSSIFLDMKTAAQYEIILRGRESGMGKFDTLAAAKIAAEEIAAENPGRRVTIWQGNEPTWTVTR